MNSIDEIASVIADSAFQVHSKLGPALLESPYVACLQHEFQKRGLKVDRQLPQPVYYHDINIDVGYRIDLLVNSSIIIESKAAEQAIPIHHAQIITYLKLSGISLGFLINFNTVLIENGIKPIANNFQEP